MPAENTKRTTKAWFTYLAEFGMIFVAVTLGFLADNLREEYSNRQKGMEYLHSFYEDLQTDTARISNIIRFEEEKVSILAGVSECYDSISRKFAKSNCVPNLVRNSLINSPFIMTERTLEQLVGGGFQSLGKQDTDSITRYLSRYRVLQDHQTTIYQETVEHLRNTSSQLFHFSAYSRIVTRNVIVNEKAFALPPGMKLFVKDDPVEMNRFFNELIMCRQVIVGHVNQLKRMRANQVRLIEFLKDKYEFE